MHHIIVDLEATCWRPTLDRTRMETIEIGAVRLAADGQPQDEFACFVRPVVEPVLSDFCKELTSIQQADVDTAALFSPAFDKFLAWIAAEPFTWYSWGDFDYRQLKRDAERVERPWPAILDNHINLKDLFAKEQALPQPMGVERALRHLQLTFDGNPHRALDDARNIARIAQHILW